jgi:hypothetical protein
MNPLPLIVIIAPEAPAVTVAGDIDAIVGDGFVGGAVPEPPPAHAPNRDAAANDSRLRHMHFR